MPLRPSKPKGQGIGVRPGDVFHLKNEERRMERQAGESASGDPAELGLSNPNFLPGGKRGPTTAKFRRGGSVRDYGK